MLHGVHTIIHGCAMHVPIYETIRRFISMLHFKYTPMHPRRTLYHAFKFKLDVALIMLHFLVLSVAIGYFGRAGKERANSLLAGYFRPWTVPSISSKQQALYPYLTKVL